jgi:hypothetical protein
MYLTIQLNLSYCMDVKYGGVLIQLQQDLEMEREGLDYGV